MGRQSVVAVSLALAGSVALGTGPVSAFEQGYPGFVQPSGVFLNTVASDPPPGLYGSVTGYDIDARLGGPGAPHVGGVPTKVQVAAIVPAVLYVPGVTVFGGDFSGFVAQPLAHTALSNPVNQDASGLHNTLIFPAQLSYKFDNLYVKPSFGLAVPTGTIDGPSGLGNNGNPWVTFLPRLALTYTKDSYTFTVNLLGEINTNNYITGYHSGSNIRVESVLTKTFGRLTIGPAFTYLAQVSNDTSSRFYNNAIHVNRFDDEALGALIGYDFGPLSLTVYGTQDLHIAASGGTPSALAPRVDSASFPRGFRFFTQLNFKIPGFTQAPATAVTARY